MNYFEASARVPLLVYHPKEFQPHRVSQNVSTLDILPTLCDLVGTKPWHELPMDGISLLPHLQGKPGHDKVYGEYSGEGTIRPLIMIKDGPWKYVHCPADEDQLFNLERDPLELVNLARLLKKVAPRSLEEQEAKAKLDEFEAETKERWDFDAISKDVLSSQRRRRLVWSSLKLGQFTSWDYNPTDDGTKKYVSSEPLLWSRSLKKRADISAPTCRLMTLSEWPGFRLWTSTARRLVESNGTIVVPRRPYSRRLYCRFSCFETPRMSPYRYMRTTLFGLEWRFAGRHNSSNTRYQID